MITTKVTKTKAIATVIEIKISILIIIIHAISFGSAARRQLLFVPRDYKFRAIRMAFRYATKLPGVCVCFVFRS